MTLHADADHYLYALCLADGKIIERTDGQFTAGFCKEVWLCAETLYTFHLEGKHLELIKKEVYFD